MAEGVRETVQGVTVPKDYQFLNPGDSFAFTCPEECWGTCCSATTIRVDPWDVLRLVRGTGVETGEILKFCQLYQGQKTPLPVVSLVRHGRCPFLLLDGSCAVYPFRPRVCRYFPVGEMIVLNEQGAVERRYFLIRSRRCKGFGGRIVYTVEDWLHQEGLEVARAMGEQFSRFLRDAGEKLQWSSWVTEEDVQELLHLLYDLDAVRERYRLPDGLADRELYAWCLDRAWCYLLERAPAAVAPVGREKTV
ncbi:MAG: YkgJ family cysteine cluster protein [Bacillota bacterium]